jgi:hypothetical protein
VATTSDPYDCDAGYANWEAGWSPDKKTWCCQSKQMGCPSPAASDPYDCDAGYTNWQAGWSDFKIQWCCENKQKGCEK